jgi:hypothetical protein
MNKVEKKLNFLGYLLTCAIVCQIITMLKTSLLLAWVTTLSYLTVFLYGLDVSDVFNELEVIEFRLRNIVYGPFVSLLLLLLLLIFLKKIV